MVSVKKVIIIAAMLTVGGTTICAQELGGLKLSAAPGLFPIGIVWPYAGRLDDPNFVKELNESGWFVADGRCIHKDVPLSDVIFSRYGDGDGEQWYKLPDYRGMFLRGVDDPTAVSPAMRDEDVGSRKINTPFSPTEVGSVQLESVVTHSHKDPGHTHNMNTANNAQSLGVGPHWQARGVGSQATVKNFTGIAEPVETTNGPKVHHGAETRPENIYVNYLILGGAASSANRYQIVCPG